MPIPEHIWRDQEERDRRRKEAARRLVAAQNWELAKYAAWHVVCLGAFFAAVAILRLCF